MIFVGQSLIFDKAGIQDILLLGCVQEGHPTSGDGVHLIIALQG